MTYLEKVVEEALQVHVYVTPGASRVRLGGANNGALRVSVRSRAVDGAATAEACKVVAEAFGLKARHVRCIRGFTSRNKVLVLEGSLPDLTQNLSKLLDAKDAASG